MPIEFRLPDVAEGIHEGKLIEWKVKEGSSVEVDQALCDIETDKSVVELPSPRKGKIIKLHFKSGDMVKVGEVLVTFEGEGTLSTSIQARVAEKKEFQQEKTSEQNSEIKILPKERKLARDLGIDITRIKGTGSDGRITAEDIQGSKGMKAVAKEENEEQKNIPLPAARLRAPPSVRQQARELGVRADQLMGTAQTQPINLQPLSIDGERIKIEGVRATIKKHLETAWRIIPHAAVAIDFNADNLVAHRKNAKSQLEKEGIKLTYLAYIIRVAADALENFPRFNAVVDDATQEFILKKTVDIGIAVDTEYGLVVPVIKNCNQKSIKELAKALQELSQKARDKKLSPNDITAGAFSITNVGSFGAKGGAGIINYPAVAILMVGAIEEKLVLTEGKVIAQKFMPLSLTFDHRILDGADAGRFLQFMIELLSDPKMQVDVI
ncbi:MAG: dihydrolipoamide acetyltransferase family protein [Nanoarchaeota archaeon]